SPDFREGEQQMEARRSGADNHPAGQLSENLPQSVSETLRSIWAQRRRAGHATVRSEKVRNRNYGHPVATINERKTHGETLKAVPIVSIFDDRRFCAAARPSAGLELRRAAESCA